VDILHPVGVHGAGRVEGFCCWWVYCRRVKAVVGIERGDTVPRSDRVVVCKLGHWQQAYPVILLFSNKRSEVGFDCLIETLGLPVGWRVKCGGHPGPDAGKL